MDNQEPIVAPGDLHGKYLWLCSVIEDSLPGVGRERPPEIGRDSDWVECTDIRDHPVYGAAFRDEEFQTTLRFLAKEVLESESEVIRTAVQARLTFVKSLVKPRDGDMGLSPILTQQLLKGIADDLESYGLPEEAQAIRSHAHGLDELVSDHERLCCIPGTNRMLTLREAFGGDNLPEKREWSFEELLEQYVLRQPQLAREREHTPEPDFRARTKALSLLESDAIRQAGGSPPRLPLEDAVELAKVIIDLNLAGSSHEHRRLIAMSRHGSYRAASREVRENPGSCYKAIRRHFARVRKRLVAWVKLRLAAAAASDDAERRAVALVYSRDVDLKKPAEIAHEFGHAGARAASSALSLARRRVESLARRALRSGLTPKDLPVPRD